MSRALTVDNILNYSPRLFDFEGEWLASFGRPELCGSWIIWGGSGSGKTRFAMKLCKYLCRFVKCAYNTLEEGMCDSIKRAIYDENMSEVADNFLLLDQESMDELTVRLRKRRSPDVIFIDSLQYTGMRYVDYKKLRRLFPRKLFVFISHAEGGEPAGSVGRRIRYDAFIKIFVEGYKAFPVSRFGGGEPFVIWEKGVQKFNCK